MTLLETNFEKYVDAIIAPLADTEAAYSQLALLADYDLMQGANLDIIGEIVGTSRVVPESIPIQFFGFQNQFGGTRFGEEGNINIGKKFREEDESAFSDSTLVDRLFRYLIKSAILKNYSHGTGDDVLKAMSIICGTDAVYVEDLGFMSFGVGIGKIITYQEQAMIKYLDLLPRPAGVQIVWKAIFDGTNFFGFDNQVGAKGFGEEGFSLGGAPFSNEF